MKRVGRGLVTTVLGPDVPAIMEIEPGEPVVFETQDAVGGRITTLEQALTCLARDHEFLTKGRVFTDDLISTWIDYKTDNEVNELKLRPHPYEFYLYYDN